MSGRRFYQNGIVIVGTLIIVLGAIYFSSRLAVSPTHPMLSTPLAATGEAINTPVTLTTPTTTVESASVTPLPTAALVSPLNLPSPLPTVASLPAITTTAQLSGPTPIYTYTVINDYPHDPEAFTEGLAFDKDVLYEGTGLQGRSYLRKVDLPTGKVLQQVALDTTFFGEGITVFGEQVYQLTWQSQQGFIYDKNSFVKQREFSYPTQGWGLTQDGKQLIMSDGTARIYFRDPITLEELAHLDVYDEQGPVVNLNELEYVRGEIYANVWQTDRIARIDPTRGQVVGWIDLTGLMPPQGRANSDAVLNGIAYQPTEDRLFVTGKLWPKLFEIQLLPK